MAPSNEPHDVARVLRAVPAFAGLEPATLAYVAREAIPRHYAAGEVLFLAGEPCAGLYIVEHGWLKEVKTAPSGREQIIRIIGAGELFNEVEVFAGVPNQTTVIALEPSVVCTISYQDIRQLMQEHSDFAHIINVDLARRVLQLLALVEDLSLRSVEARLARVLLDNAAGDEVPRRRWTTQAEMAARLGTVPDVLNRALRSLVEDGLIELDRRRIKILDAPRLTKKAAGET
jgi:CRP/FNR family cyclic AMP-dependent transcriptional regulator